MDRQYEEKIDGSRFVLTFLAAAQETLHEEWDAMCWNECLRRAHLAGRVPIGPVITTSETYVPPPQTELKEGTRMTPNPFEGGDMLGFMGRVGQLVKVTSEVELDQLAGTLPGTGDLDAHAISNDIDPTGLEGIDLSDLEAL